MNKFINFLVQKISKTNPEFSELELKKMEYGLICIFSEITKIIPFFIIFYFFSLEKYYIIAIIFFCPVRIFSGGYHAKTYWGCFFISFIIFAIIIILGKYFSFNIIMLVSSLIISFILICIFAPVDNINKRIKSESRRLSLKYFSIAITFFLSGLCYFIPYQFLNTAVISIVSAVLLMMIGKISDKNADKKNCQQ